MGYANDWGKVYNSAMGELQKLKNAPGMNAVGGVATGTQPLLQALVKIDAADPETKKLSEREAALKQFQKEIKAFEKEAKKYDGLIDKGLKAVEPEKTTYSAGYRQLKILKAELKALGARLTHSANQSAKSEKVAKLIEKQHKVEEKLRDKNKTDEEVNDATYELKAKGLLLTFSTNLKSVIGKSAAAVQKAKASYTPANFNASIGANARFLSQTFNNIYKMQNDPQAKKSKIVKQIPDMTPYKDLLKKYGNDLQNIPDTTPEATVKEYVKEFNALLADMTKIAEKFAKIK